MKKALQIIEKNTKLTYRSTMSGLNYRWKVKAENTTLGAVSLHLNESNPITNTKIYDILHKKEYTLIKEQTMMIFQGLFDELATLGEVTTYYPDTGLLVYNVEQKRLLLHLQRESVECQGIVIGNVLTTQGVHVLQSLRDKTSCVIASENSKNFFFRRTLNISLAVSLLLLANGLSFQSTHEPGWFIRNEQDFNAAFPNKQK